MAMARERNDIVINADASQLYADLPILSARPSAADEAAVPHRLYGMLDGANACSAAQWAAMARAEIARAWDAGKRPILVGGTGLYLRTLLDGIADVPAVADEVRMAVRAMAPQAVRAALEAEDAAMAARLHANDSQRNARALEVMRATGRSLADWHKRQSKGGLGQNVALDARVVELDRGALQRRIDARLAAMWAAGALEEAARLRARGLSPALPVMRAIGVPPLLALLDGVLSEAEARERWRLDTYRYAKRQQTWMRNQLGGWARHRAASEDGESLHNGGGRSQ